MIRILVIMIISLVNFEQVKADNFPINFSDDMIEEHYVHFLNVAYKSDIETEYCSHYISTGIFHECGGPCVMNFYGKTPEEAKQKCMNVPNIYSCSDARCGD